MLYGFLITIQLIISALLVIVILLQSSKGGGLAGVAGGLASSTVFGGRSAANFLTKSTSVLATLFFLNCLGMAVLSSSTGSTASVTQQAVSTEATQESPVPSAASQPISSQPIDSETPAGTSGDAANTGTAASEEGK